MAETPFIIDQQSKQLKKKIAQLLFKYSQGYSLHGVRTAFNNEVRSAIEGLVLGKLCKDDVKIRVTHHSLKGYKIFIHSKVGVIDEILKVSGFDGGVAFEDLMKNQMEG